MIIVEQATKSRGMCYICGTLMRENHVITIILPKDAAPRAAHLYCYALMQKRRQQQEQRKRELLHS